jgi:CubicO group peptidase (beta-lactamase class C family)
MKKYILLITATLFTMVVSYAQNKQQQIDEIIDYYRSVKKFNGSVLVAEKGSTLLQKGYGFRNVGKQLTNEVQTIFLIGSITKEFTATVVLKLSEAKKLSLSDLLSKYYKDFPEGSRITVEHLLTQTSGIFNYTDTEGFWDKSQIPTNEQEVVAFLEKKPLSSQPGEKFAYSNSNYMLLAYIIQKVTGKSYETVVTEMIFKPLGMTDSGFDFAKLKSSDKATGYWKFSPTELVEGPPSDPTQFIGSGEIYSTVGDLYKWHKALQTGRILSIALQQKAYTPLREKYGYGWEVMDSIANKQVVGHGGRMLSGFETRMIRVPSDDIFIVLLNNHADGPPLNIIGKDILSILYGKSYSNAALNAFTTKELMGYTGKFGEKDRYLEIRLINGGLFILDSGERLQVTPFQNKSLRFTDDHGQNVELAIVMNSEGICQSISIRGRNGATNTLNRID